MLDCNGNIPWKYKKVNGQLFKEDGNLKKIYI